MSLPTNFKTINISGDSNESQASGTTSTQETKNHSPIKTTKKSSGSLELQGESNKKKRSDSKTSPMPILGDDNKQPKSSEESNEQVTEYLQEKQRDDGSMERTHHHSLWERFLIKAQSLTPTALSDLIDSEKRRILKEMEERGHLTQEEADYFNKMTRESIEKILNSFKESCLKHLEVTPLDPPAQVKFKIGFAEELLEWLADLFGWVINKIQEIFQVTGEKLEWCIEQTKKLFEYIKSLFK